MKEYLLPYFEDRTAEVDMLVFHCSAFPAEKVLYYLNEYKCSCHYILDEKAELVKVVDETKAAQHAGAGFWRGSDASVNARSIGIEICNETLGQEPYSEEQIAKLIPFAQKLIRKYNLKAQNIVGHSDIAPLRKADPGKAFPWKRLAREGIGLWYQPRNAEKVSEEDAAKLLKSIGYDTRSDEAILASAYAFCRHFLPQYVQTDSDVAHLVDHILPNGFDFIAEDKFMQTLKAVAYSYK